MPRWPKRSAWLALVAAAALVASGAPFEQRGAASAAALQAATPVAGTSGVDRVVITVR